MLVEILKPIKIRKGTLQPGIKLELPESIATQLFFDEKVKPIGQGCASTFTPAKLAKVESTLVAPSVSAITPKLHKNVQNSEPSWQRDFCEACGDFNSWRGCCPLSIDDCLLSRILDCEGDIETLKGHSIGQGVKTDDVIQLWVESGEVIENLFKKPVWLFCIAEHINKGREND